MKVFELGSDVDNYQWFNVVNEKDLDRVEAPNAEPLGPTWTPLKVILEERHLPLSDTPSLLVTCRVFSARAVEMLRPLLEGNGELLPLDCQDGEFHLFNVTRVIDALDMERTQFRRYSDGTTGRILKHVFMAEKLRETTIFKVPVYHSFVYVTDRFRQAVEHAGLTGFEFLEVWSEPDAWTRAPNGKPGP